MMRGSAIGALSAAVLTLAAASRFVRTPARSLAGQRSSRRRARGRWRLGLVFVGTAVVGVVAIAPAALAPICVPFTAAIVVRRWHAARSRQAARHRVAQRFPDAVDLFVVAVRAGYLPVQAMRQIRHLVAGDLRAPIDATCARLDGGDLFSDALETLRLAVGAAAHPFVDALAAADRYGLPLNPVLDRLVTEARDQRRRDGQAQARELPVRLAVPLVVCTLPSFALLAIAPLLLGALSSLHL